MNNMLYIFYFWSHYWFFDVYSLHYHLDYKNILYQTINSIEDGIMSLTAYKNLSTIQKTAISQLSKTYSLLGIIGNLMGDTQFLHDNQNKLIYQIKL